MAALGVQMMMVREAVARDGMWPVLQRISALDFHAVEVSQIPMSEENTEALERGRAELGLQVAALSVGLKSGPTTTGDALDSDFEKIVADCRRLGCRFVRIGMMPFPAMASYEACVEWAEEVEAAAVRLAAEGITLCYHNHHVDFAKFGGERLFDLVRRIAPALRFEVDLHWVQRAGIAPLDMLKQYAGVVDLIHVKDFRIVPLPQSALALLEAGDFPAFMAAFSGGTVQFAEVGSGNMNWPELLPAAEAAGASYLLVEQDDLYGRDPFDCLADSRAYLRSIGY